MQQQHRRPRPAVIAAAVLHRCRIYQRWAGPRTTPGDTGVTAECPFG
jgi:hypothetical protein